MRFTGVIVRFLSLLDIALLLLGVLMLALVQTTMEQADSTHSTSNTTRDSTLETKSFISQVGFIYIFAGWGDELGKFYLLDSNLQRRREVSIDTEEEIRELVDGWEKDGQRADVIMILRDPDGWYSKAVDNKVSNLDRLVRELGDNSNFQRLDVIQILKHPANP